MIAFATGGPIHRQREHGEHARWAGMRAAEARGECGTRGKRRCILPMFTRASTWPRSRYVVE